MFVFQSFKKGESEVKCVQEEQSSCACPCAFICLDGGRINCVLCTSGWWPGGWGPGGKNGAIKKTEREMQVSATSRHCERNG